MQVCHLEFNSNFHVVLHTTHSQAAVMVLPAGDSTGGPDNQHGDSDQWLYVISGEGEAVVEQQRQQLKPGTLLLIERKETHQITNIGKTPLQTINFYVPPAYTSAEGESAERD